MRSKKITAAVLGSVLTLGLVVSGCGGSSARRFPAGVSAEEDFYLLAVPTDASSGAFAADRTFFLHFP